MEILLYIILIPLVMIAWPLVCIVFRLLFGGMVVLISTLTVLLLAIGAIG